MKFIIKSILFLLGLINFQAFSQSVENSKDTLKCGSALLHSLLLKDNKDYKKKYTDLQLVTNKFVAEEIGGLNRTEDIILPVVVHVIYSNPINSAIDNQINQMIALLNQNFNQNSPNRSSIPSAFLPIEGNMRLKFVLARRDASCNNTTGITYRTTSVPNFVVVNSINDPIKTLYPGWDPSKYLNIWITDVPLYENSVASDNLMNGYAYNPANGLSGADGLVIILSRINTPTVTHEMGHYFNLTHIWGDDSGACTGSDFVDDTPNQANSNIGTCPTFPSTSQSCSDTGPNGTMFTNFLNYSTCRNMFSQGQCQRMDASLFASIASRNYLLGSNASIPPVVVSDLFIQDTPEDMGNEPNNESPILYLSNDIWVRNTNNWQDGISNQIHQNPEFHNGTTNKTYIYVRVRNRGCSGSQTGTLKLYWAKASTGLAWENPWTGNISTPSNSSIKMGGEVVTRKGGGSFESIGEVSINGGESKIYVFEWNVPNPQDYVVDFSNDNKHFCLLARIETSTTAPFGMANPETNTLWENVKNNNNIAWKNLSIVDLNPTMMVSGVTYGNYSNVKNTYLFKINNTKKLLVYGSLYLETSYSNYIRHFKNKVKLNDIKDLGRGKYQIIGNNPSINNVVLKPNQQGYFKVIMKPNYKYKEQLIIPVDVEQHIIQENNKTIFVGGERFVFKIMNKK